jgi:hypothetical protein
VTLREARAALIDQRSSLDAGAAALARDGDWDELWRHARA